MKICVKILAKVREKLKIPQAYYQKANLKSNM
jgi:hypothetical protein